MKIVCFGDSNTYGYDPRSYFGGRLSAEDCWVNILAEKLGCIAVNAGENGREIPHSEWALSELERLLEDEMPIDLLAVMLGTNDLLQGNSVTDVVNRMLMLLAQLDLDLCKVLLITPPDLRLGEWVASEKLVDASRELHEAYAGIANTLGVQFVDTKEWNLPLFYDGVHLSEEGHRGMAEGLFYYLKKENELCCRLA